MSTIYFLTVTGSLCVFSFLSQISSDANLQEAQSQATDKAAETKVAAHEANATSSQPWIPLFQNGLDGWVAQDGKLESWTGENGVVSCVSAGGGWLRTEKMYGDFNFKVEYRLQSGGNTGIGLRCPPLGNPTFTGLEVQLLDDTSEKYQDLRPSQYTGSIYYRVAPQRRARLESVGEWNQCEIRCVSDEVTVSINGEVVNQFQLTQFDKDAEVNEQTQKLLRSRPPLGHLALQSHSTRVDFRNAMIQPLSVTTPTGLQYVDLADGNGDAVSADATVTIHYAGQLADGKRFTDSRSIGKPVTVPLDKVIDGWKEGIQGMKAGGKRRLIVPPELAYGDKGVKDLIPPGATLVFEVELCAFER